MTPEEIEVSTRIRELVTAYEKTEDSKVRAGILKEASSLRDITEYDFENYWRSQSLEEFADFAAIEKIKGNEFSKDEAMTVLKEVCALTPEDVDRIVYLLTKYGTAIEFVFKKSDYIWSAVFEENKSYSEVIEDLNGSSGGAICL